MPSIYVYLNNEVKNLSGFTAIATGGPGKDYYRVDSSKLCLEDGRFHLFLTDLEHHIPEFLTTLITEVSVHDSINYDREAGLYVKESARGTVEDRSIRIRGPRMDHVYELLHAIKVGTIRPSESYGGVQSGLSRRELELQLEEHKGAVSGLEARAERLEKELKESQVETTRLKELIEDLNDDLAGTTMFANTRSEETKKIREKITQIFEYIGQIETARSPILLRNVVSKKLRDILCQ